MFFCMFLLVVFLVLHAIMSRILPIMRLCTSILGTCKWSVDPLCPVTFVIKPQSVSQSVSQQSLYISLIWDYALCVCDWILPMIGWILVLHATECRLSIGRGSQRIRSFHKSKQVKGNDYPCMECQIAFLKLVSDFIISATPAAAYISYNGRCTNDVKI